MRAIATLASILLSGCASNPTVSVIQPFSDDVSELGHLYRVSAQASTFRGGETGAKEMAHAEAAKQCAKERMYVRTMKIETGEGAKLPIGTVNLTFRCLSDWDPKFYQSNLGPNL